MPLNPEMLKLATFTSYNLFRFFRLWYSAQCCIAWIRFGQHTKCISRTLHPIFCHWSILLWCLRFIAQWSWVGNDTFGLYSSPIWSIALIWLEANFEPIWRQSPSSPSCSICQNFMRWVFNNYNLRLWLQEATQGVFLSFSCPYNDPK